MISLLHEKEYELLGEVEIRRADWLRIRQEGWFRFVFKWCSSSYGGRIAATLVFSIALGHIDPLRRLGGYAWTALAYAAFGLVAGAIHATRAWRRLERRFAPGTAE